ncbi:hypothetical protein HDU92_006113 [Lobulomyces angularis]|nr:hypothetical protein HDU92_006113 [Lobulomyces angularis]
MRPGDFAFAAFYTAIHLIKNTKHDIKVDMFEKLPCPFGLVRFGVAPDHPEVKNVLHKFDAFALSEPKFNFYGNVTIGKDISLSDLQEAYNFTVLAYGSEKDNELYIKNEHSKNVFSARAFVGWYNGHPEFFNLNPDLSNVREVSIIGMGNVSLDCARLLLSPPSALENTDITKHAFEVLRNSKVERVRILGRRGPMEVAFTSKELREMDSIPNLKFKTDLALLKNALEDSKNSLLLSKDRPRKRLLENLNKFFKKNMEGSSKKTFQIDFLKSPKEVILNEDGSLHSLKVEKNELCENGKVEGTNIFEEIRSDMIIKSVGYKSVALEGLPFNEKKGFVPNISGRVVDANSTVIAGLYVSGWLKRGPTGVIASTMFDANETAGAILKDLEESPQKLDQAKTGFEAISKRLNVKRIVTFTDWKKIEKHEFDEGIKVGKVREKLSNIDEMLRICDKL